MQLQQFVRETLVQVIRGIQEAAEDVGIPAKAETLVPIVGYAFSRGANVREISTLQDIEFDVAVVASESNSKSDGGGGGISVVGLQIGGRTEAEKARATETTSRVRFSVPVQLPGIRKAAPKG
eukprot:g15759.t1